jgi:hypothetical protein
MSEYKRTGRVVATYSVYNAEKLLRNSMTSALPFVDEYLVYDGRYAAFRCPCRTDHDNSCDNTLKEVDKFVAATGAKVEVVQTKLMPEFDKRNMMFDAVALGDTVVIIDDDEIFYGLTNPVHNFALGVGGYISWRAARLTCLKWRHSYDPQDRFFVKTEGLRHVQPIPGSFSYAFADKAGLIKPEEYIMLDNVRMINLYGTANEIGYREQSRDGARAEYNELGINRKLPDGLTTKMPS